MAHGRLLSNASSGRMGYTAALAETDSAMRPALPLCLAVACAMAAPPTTAILTRPDRDDEEYRELATRYASAVSLGEGAGAGVLIAPRWILTTAERAAALREGSPARAIAMAGRRHEIQQVFVHPDWKPGRGSDIALVFLKEAVAGVEPTPIYRGTDEPGETVRLVGFGPTGRIGDKAPSIPADGRARASINTVDRVLPGTLGLRLKGPEEASDLQGAVTPGDTGGPAYVEIAGRILVGGLILATEDANRDGIVGNIGDWERLTRVSAYAAWIDDVMGKAALEEAARKR
jgi:hypothetical protein